MEKAFDNCIQNQYSCIAMNRVILQVPMSKELREKAEAVAKDAGFASLQNTVRTFLERFSKREVTLDVTKGEVVHLSKRAERRYAKMDEDFKHGRNIYKPQNDEEFFKLLRE